MKEVEEVRLSLDLLFCFVFCFFKFGLLSIFFWFLSFPDCFYRPTKSGVWSGLAKFFLGCACPPASFKKNTRYSLLVGGVCLCLENLSFCVWTNFCVQVIVCLRVLLDTEARICIDQTLNALGGNPFLQSAVFLHQPQLFRHPMFGYHFVNHYTFFFFTLTIICLLIEGRQIRKKRKTRRKNHAEGRQFRNMRRRGRKQIFPAVSCAWWSVLLSLRKTPPRSLKSIDQGKTSLCEGFSEMPPW